MILISLFISCESKNQQPKFTTLTPVNFSEVQINDSFWAPRLKLHSTATLNACIDQIQNQTARISNFEKAAGLKEGSHEGIYFDDSDVYKAMEGIAYSLVNNPNPELEALMDRWIDLISLAQEPDGYLNTYYSLTGLENRWTDMTKHEMYCGGHLIEAAIAYYDAIGGHAVRAMYTFTGMADVAAETNDTVYIAALNRVWEDVVFRNMYITGGIGPSAENEGFTEDYDLPNESAYCETCASVGMVFWNQRMNNLTGESKYIDVLERALYNGALAGISLPGDLFFYVNPLESSGNHHRQEWYGCACCPSQVSRFLPSIGNYIYSLSKKDVWLNLFVGSSVNLKIEGEYLQINQKTNYPWDGKVAIHLNPEKDIKFGLRIRIPDWCKDYTVKLKGKSIKSPEIINGYLVLSNKWKKGDSVEVEFYMPVNLVQADPRVLENTGKCAIQRGPLVYCIEQTDNRNVGFDSLLLSTETNFELMPGDSIQDGLKLIKASSMNSELMFLPYYAWDNREAGRMKVWIPFRE
jgi:DUF1680 family protein